MRQSVARCDVYAPKSDRDAAQLILADGAYAYDRKKDNVVFAK